MALSNPSNSQVLTYNSALGKWQNLNNIPSDATTAAKGIVELATAAEAAIGTDTVRAVTAAGIAAIFASANMSWSTASGLTTRPVLPQGVSVRIWGATTAQAQAGLSWLIDGDYIEVTS